MEEIYINGKIKLKKMVVTNTAMHFPWVLLELEIDKFEPGSHPDKNCLKIAYEFQSKTITLVNVEQKHSDANEYLFILLDTSAILWISAQARIPPFSVFEETYTTFMIYNRNGGGRGGGLYYSMWNNENWPQFLI